MTTISPPRILLAALTALACVATTATAETHRSLAPIPDDPIGETSKPYSETVALAAPLIATAASAGLLVVGAENDIDDLVVAGAIGLFVGPSLGHVYTRDWGGALIGTGVRAAGVGIVAFGFLELLADEDGESKTGIDAGVFVTLGSLTYLGGVIYSIVDAPYSANRANNERQQFTLTPAPIQGPDRSTGWGAAMQMTF